MVEVQLDATGGKIADVRTGGIQLPDGSIDSDEDPPSIDIYIFTDDGIHQRSGPRAGLVLLEAAAEVDRWVRD